MCLSIWLGVCIISVVKVLMNMMRNVVGFYSDFRLEFLSMVLIVMIVKVSIVLMRLIRFIR